MRRVSEYVKMSLAVLMVLATTIFCAMRLLKVQVVESESYNRKEAVINQYTQKIESTRGEIVDAQGTTIISNHVSYAAAIDEKNAREMEKKFREQTFTLDDFLTQLYQIKKMGNIEQLLGMIPGMKAGALKDAQVDEAQMKRIEAIILSMTKTEREKPEIINGSRRRRIALGSGTSVEDVNKLLRQFEQMKKMMKQFSGMGKKRFGGMKLPF